MRTTELFRTCANEHVAAAALASLGGRLRRRVITLARRDGLSAGLVVSSLLAEYDRRASIGRRRELESQMKTGDMPLLSGLRHVLETALSEAWEVETAFERGASAFTPAARGWDRVFAPSLAPTVA